MRKKEYRYQYDSQEHEDIYAHAAGAIGGLGMVLAVLIAIKSKLGLNWPATILLAAGTLVALGYVAWRVKAAVMRWWTREPAETPPKTTTLAQPLPEAAAETAVPIHPELTAALTRTGAIGRDEVIAQSDVRVEELPGIGIKYTFLVPEGRTHEDVSKRLGPIASMLGVTRLHLKLETSRHTEREVRLLKLDQPPFSRLFAPPTKEQIRAYDGVPFGYDVTGALAGVKTFDKASMLIAGMTQMGKTTLVNGLITCLLIAYGEFDLYLLDGKLCGLTKFEKLAVRYEASDDPSVMESMLDDLLSRVDGRYIKLQDAIRNRQPTPKFRPVFFIVDEAADFYTDNGTKESITQVRRVEDKSRSLVAKSLESGISTIMLTQRPAKEAIPVKVRDQFLYRMCLYVASEGGAKVALGDSYFDTIAPIHPALLDPAIKGQAVLFANGASTLLRGFNFADAFIWGVVDEVHAQRTKKLENQPTSPRKKAIDLMRAKGVDFMATSDLAEALGIEGGNSAAVGLKLSKLLEVAPHKASGGVRGYLLADLTAAAMSDS
ncbi:FtsK/SpoIIIE domain-containing protein [Streptomyces sp. NPDC057743]|uniref:FtsK/SpoIIIE domain-containing protein n=1 Tax=Streptomyces sp. NPDC057743 TaxID=3346236 RepID=UPI00368E7956